jgi:hypothetical protein
MVLRYYSLGALTSFIVIGLGITAYIHSENIEGLGLKAALYGALILATILWPIGLPTAMVIIGKGILGKITSNLFNDANKKIDEKVEKQ